MSIYLLLIQRWFKPHISHLYATAERHFVEEEIAEIRKGFPFNAAEVLNDTAKQEEYMMSLKLRAKQCEIETKQVKDTITELLRGTIHG